MCVFVVCVVYECVMVLVCDGMFVSVSDGDGDVFVVKMFVRTFDGARYGFVAATRCRGAAVCVLSCVEVVLRLFVVDVMIGKV